MPDHYIGRFAPTPSGPLHLGSLVAALGSYLDARAHQGAWLLRIDDLDEQRCRPQTTKQIIDQLSAHGLVADAELIQQRSRHDLYAKALTTLREANLSYSCLCSRKQLRDAAHTGQAAYGLAGPIYPGTCRNRGLVPSESSATRFIVPTGRIEFIDRFLGPSAQSLPTTIGDPILQRSDGVFAYHLAEVVDNQAMGISHIVRGADLAPLTPLHIALHCALYPDSPPPVYGHLPLVLGSDGRKLSKTNHAPALDIRRARENLSIAAEHLGLKTPTVHTDIKGMLANLTRQWSRQHLTSKDNLRSSD